MAKRKVFEIKLNGEVIATKYAYNASIRFIENHVSEVAKVENTNYNLVESSGVKEGFYHSEGVRVWQGDNGNRNVYEVKQIGI